MNMKKIGEYIGLLFMMIFLSSCPMESLEEDYFCLCINNNTSQTLNIEVAVNNWNVVRDNIGISSTSEFQGFGYKEFPESFYDILISDLKNKHIIITTTSGDTLANWNDSSAVFNQQYWLIEHQENGDVHCTLQLTDEVLKLR